MTDAGAAGSGGYIPAAGSDGSGGAAGAGGAGGSVADGGVDDVQAEELYADPVYVDERLGIEPDAFEKMITDCLPDPGDEIETCAASDCIDLPSCCVGQGDCCADSSLTQIPEQLDFSLCEGQQLAECLSADGWPADAFGPRSSQIHGDAFYPGGDDSGDSGVRFTNAFDLPSQRVSVSAVFHDATECGQGCLEGVGIGFSADDALPAHVAGDVALVYSGSLGQVRLMVGGIVTGQTPLTGTQQKWTLELQPSGRALAYAEDDADNTVFDTSFEPRAASRLMLYGRNSDPSATDGVHLSALEVNAQLCDIPYKWAERDELTILTQAGDEWQPDTAASPSVAYDDAGKAALVFEKDGNIYLASREGEDPYTFTLSGNLDEPVLRTTLIEGATGLRDPWLLWDGGYWVIYFVIDRETGETEIASFLRTLAGDVVTEPAPVTFSDYSGVVDAPSVVHHADNTWIMVARVDDDVKQLAVFTSRDGLDWKHLETGNLGEVLNDTCANALDAFFCDGIDAPALSWNNSSWQLYYAGRRGTRRAIGLLVSDNLLKWRHVSEAEPVFGPSGSGFDRLSVTDPQAVARQGEVELFYVGSDGYRNRLGRAWRSAVSDRF